MLFPAVFDFRLYSISLHKHVAVLLTLIVWGIGIFFAIWLLANLYELLWGKRRSAKRAANFSAEVDGSFLRVVDGKSDRKIHFRQIGDYEAMLNKRDANFPSSIRMRLTSLNSQFLVLHGVQDPIATRDMLAQIDAERE